MNRMRLIATAAVLAVLATFAGGLAAQQPDTRDRTS